MERNTTERGIVEDFLSNTIQLRGTFIRTITRENGEIDRKAIPNIVTKDGLNLLASRGVADTGSKCGWIGVGTENYTPHINSQTFGESSRKTASGLISSSQELIVAIATWGGDADSVTSQQLEMAGIANHQTIDSGIMLNIADGVSTVLADSDFLHLEIQVRVGSHNL